MDHTSAASMLIKLIEEYHDFNAGPICEYAYPSALNFSHQVSRGRPCVYNVKHYELQKDRGRATGLTETSCRAAELERECIMRSPAFMWTAESLCRKVGEEVEIAVTPDGRADALYTLPAPQGRNLDKQGGDEPGGEEQVFVQPATTHMTLATLLDKITLSDEQTEHGRRSSQGGRVYYLQSQNSNLTSTPLAPLLADLPSTIPFATPTLGDPEAINIWIGDHASVTSTHRDPYENLYLVLRGSKTFTLYAPVEELCLHATMVRTGRLVQAEAAEDDGNTGFGIELDTPALAAEYTCEGGQGHESPEARIPWIPISPILPRPYLNKTYPYYKHARPQTVTVRAGQMLYLPSGWFHHVTQECGVWDDGTLAPCIAVNYWFDMDYQGERFVMRQMIGRLLDVVKEEQSR